MNPRRPLAIALLLTAFALSSAYAADSGTQTLDLMLERPLRDKKHAEKVCPKSVKQFGKDYGYKNARWTGKWENLPNGKSICYSIYDK